MARHEAINVKYVSLCSVVNYELGYYKAINKRKERTIAPTKVIQNFPIQRTPSRKHHPKKSHTKHPTKMKETLIP
jgi:hypothetical protein